jgi:hypothetical protein
MYRRRVLATGDLASDEGVAPGGTIRRTVREDQLVVRIIEENRRVDALATAMAEGEQDDHTEDRHRDEGRDGARQSGQETSDHEGAPVDGCVAGLTL